MCEGFNFPLKQQCKKAGLALFCFGYFFACTTGSANLKGEAKRLAQVKEWKQKRKQAHKKEKLYQTTLSGLTSPKKRAFTMMLKAENEQVLAKVYRQLAVHEHQNQMKKWDTLCRKQKAAYHCIRPQIRGRESYRALSKYLDCEKKRRAHKCPKPPRLVLQRSYTYINKAIKTHQDLVQKYPNQPQAPKAHYLLVSGLFIAKRHQQALKEATLFLRNHPQHVLVPDLYLLKANYYFGIANKAAQAFQNYQQARKRAGELLKNAKTTASQKPTFRMLQLRALYMLAWCDFNLGRYEKAIAKFKTALQHSRQCVKSGDCKQGFENEALRDLIRVFAKMGTTKKAYLYYRKVKGKQYAYKAIKKLASRYYREGNYQKAVETFRLLMVLNLKGEKDLYGPEAPIFQNEIVRSLARISKPKELLKEVLKLTTYLDPKHPWYIRWHKHKTVYTDSYERAEQTMLEYSTKYHKMAQNIKPKNKRAMKKKTLYLLMAMQLYELYMKYFHKTESAYELRFFLAELLYDLAQKSMKPTKGSPYYGYRGYLRMNLEARNLFLKAAHHYHKTSLVKTKAYIRQAIEAEALCYETLLQYQEKPPFRRLVHSQSSGGKLPAFQKHPKTGKFTWKKRAFSKLEKRLVKVYQYHLSIVKKKELRTKSLFKMGLLYYRAKQYIKSFKIFEQLGKEAPKSSHYKRTQFLEKEVQKAWNQLHSKKKP